MIRLLPIKNARIAAVLNKRIIHLTNIRKTIKYSQKLQIEFILRNLSRFKPNFGRMN